MSNKLILQPSPRMATEYGFQALPSVHAWQEAAEPLGTGSDDWDYDGRMIDFRQHHPCGNKELVIQVQNQLGPPRSTPVEQKFLDMIYLTQVKRQIRH